MIKIVMVFVLLMCFASAVPAAKVSKKSNGRGDVVELSQKLRKVIRLVEKSEMACGPRNTLVRRLRLVDDALVSGQRTGASGLLAAWIKRTETMAAAGTLHATLHVKLKTELQAILEQIGTGWSETAGPTRNWPPLPPCDPWVTGRVGDYEVWDGKEDVMTLITTTIKEIHPPGRVGILVGGLIKIFWPGQQQPDISTLIDQAIDDLVRQQLMDDLAGLEGVLNNFNYYENAWYEKCGANPSACTPLDGESVRSEYLNAVDFFTNARPHFQSNGPAGDYRVQLLDLYAQYETMYLSLLGEGVVWGADWGWTGGDLAKPGLDLAAELDPDNKESGVGYVKEIYQSGIPYPDKYDFDTDTQIPTHYQDKWTENNAYIRDMTLNVLQIAAAWPYMDPVAWPNGNPDFKYEAMIYSDPVGYRGVDSNGDDLKVSGPANVSAPLSHVKVWVQDEFENATGYITAVIDSMQMTNYPSPAGPRMGDTSNDWNCSIIYGCDVAPGTVYGPIWAVSATDDEYSSDPGSHVQSLKFSFGNGQNSPLLGSTYGPKHTYYFAYEDWFVANAKIMGTQKVHYDWKYKPLLSADCLIFGFRRDDSF